MCYTYCDEASPITLHREYNDSSIISTIRVTCTRTMCCLSTSIEPSYRACLRIEPSEPPEPFRAALGGVVVDDSCDGARGFACPRLRSKTWLGEHHTSERRRGRKIVAARGCGRGRSSGCPAGRAIKRDAHARTRQFCFERPLRRVQGMHRASRMCCALFRSRIRLLYK